MLIEQLRLLGNETLTHWTGSAEQKVSQELKFNTAAIEQREKNAEVVEHLWAH